MSSGSLTTTIGFLKLTESDLTIALQNDTQKKLDNFKYCQNECEEITFNFQQEKVALKAQQDSIEDKTSTEYDELITEIKDLDQEMNRAIESIREEENNFETQVDAEIAQLEIRLQATKADREAFEECRDQNIKEEFAYFQ